MIAGRISMARAGVDPLRAFSNRLSDEVDSGFEAGVVGSPVRHSHGTSEAARPPPVVGSAAGSGRDSDFAGSQQHAVVAGAAQQARGAFDAAFAVQADTSLDTDIIPAIATMAIQGRRR